MAQAVAVGVIGEFNPEFPPHVATDAALAHAAAALEVEAQRVSSLTEVAGTAVLGSRLVLLGVYGAGWRLLAIATLCFLMLTLVLRVKMSQKAAGGSFFQVVAPQSLAILAAQMVSHQHLGVGG